MPNVVISQVTNATTIASTPIPSAPSSGSITIYNTNGVYYQINSAGEISRLTSFIDQFDIDFYTGDNAPYIADIDAFGFQDAAGFPVGEDRDVVFKVGANVPYWKQGATLDVVIAPSVTDVGKKVKWKLDYLVHVGGEVYSGGTSYSSTFDMTVSASQNQLQKTQAFTIPNGHIPLTAVEVEFRLTRLGTDINDTFSGDIGLKHLVIRE